MHKKVGFIVELLNSKKITVPQKEKLLLLTAEEFKTFSSKDIDAHNEIAAIKEQMLQIKQILQAQNILVDIEETQEHSIENQDETLNQKNDEIGTKGKLTIYKDPKHLSEFLKMYNKNPILKYTCHEIDELDDILNQLGSTTFVYETYIELVRKEYNKIVNFYYDKINSNIQGLIWAYLIGGKTWSSDKITINWCSKELKEWCLNNPSKIPNPGLNLKRRSHSDGFEFANFKTKNTNNTVRTFSQLVIHFKNLFHIRSDNSLKKLIQIKNETEKFTDKINFKLNIPENIEFFTDVDKVLQAYERIIDMVLDFVEKNNNEIPTISLSLIEINGFIIFSIHHENSIFGKTISNCIARVGQREFNLIENQINGVANLVLKADFGEGNYAEVNLWDGKIKLAKDLEIFDGVEFQLIFKL